ncbi:hypothetical protein Bca52824_002188 [Brassica carinata]|uniref:Uncharacterized protein n=1 Tax=Brassica carinata TaxID=52824 RepID=A0A8X7WHG5_BRACI|nr:hypothetical protein Bca52824_002188 [Brassica carinata]
MEQQFWQTDHSKVPAVIMNQALEEQQHVPWSAQPHVQYKGQDNAVRYLPAQLQLEEQDNVPLMNQAMEEQAASLTNCKTPKSLFNFLLFY